MYLSIFDSEEKGVAEALRIDPASFLSFTLSLWVCFLAEQ
jgi:hypothetical protein